MYHVLSRGNARGDVFREGNEFATFVKSLREAAERLPMRLKVGWLMPRFFLETEPLVGV